MSALIDLGGPRGGRFWRVTTGQPVDHPDAQAAAVQARVTGSVGCTYNGVKVERVIIAFHCPECGRTWTTEDDPNEWAYGHDCEAEVRS